MKTTNLVPSLHLLSNGLEIPSLGYGTYKTPTSDEGLQMIKNAVEVGYRHIDTAQGYKNENLVGQAIRESGLPREDFWVTSKLANTNQGYSETKDAINSSLTELGFDYIDLYLIHWPIAPGHKKDWKQRIQSSWKVMEEAYRVGKLKAIGVSNFLPHHLDALLETAEIIPMVNQIEFHPKYQQQEVFKYCSKKNILIESWGPLMRGKAFDEPVLVKLSEKSGHTIAQLLLRYCLENNILPLQKTSKKERMVENAQIFNFNLSNEELSILDNMNTTTAYTLHPDTPDEWVIPTK